MLAGLVTCIGQAAFAPKMAARKSGLRQGAFRPVGVEGVESPLAFETLEHMRASVVECESGWRRQGTRRLRDEDFTCGCLPHDPSGLVNGDPLPDVDRRSLAVEPMTCAPNAFRSGEGLIVLESGRSTTSTWGIAPTAA